MNLIETAKAIAVSAHSGQTRRDGITPYAYHPAKVARKLLGESQEVIATAWLHDVLEDTKETVLTLREYGIPDDVIVAVDALTKTDGIVYDEYLAGVKANPIARKVKVADMLANLADEPTPKQVIKYSKGLLFLLNE